MSANVKLSRSPGKESNDQALSLGPQMHSSTEYASNPQRDSCSNVNLICHHQNSRTGNSDRELTDMDIS